MTKQHVMKFKGQNASSHLQSNETDEEDSFGQQVSVLSIFIFMDKKHLNILMPALLLTIIAGAIKPVITILLGRIFNDLVSFGLQVLPRQQLLDSVSTWCIAITGLGIATMVVNGTFFALWLLFGEMQARSVRDKAFQYMIKKEMSWYDLRADGIGPLLVRMQTQIRELQIATSQPLGFFIEDTAAALAALGIAFYYSWNLTLVILGFVPLTVMLLALVTRNLKPAIEKQKKYLSEASKYSCVAIKEVDTVKVFNGQDLEIWQYVCAIKKAAKSYAVQAKANSLQIGITRFMTTAMFIVGFWYGMVLFRKGLDAGSVLTTFYSCLMATQAVEALLPQWLVLAKGMSAGETLKQIFSELHHGRRISNMVGTVKPFICQGDVKLSRITFSYPSNPYQNSIDNASFFFPAGKMSFVVGRSGSGKSTLGNLLMNFYRPSSGNISIDGKSIQILDLEWLRRNVCFVQQESVLFNDTMFRNIALGRRPHTSVAEDEVREASQIAMLQQTINDLPEGLQTTISSSGNSLSGGQKQRVAIARARLHDAPILILDEATSALDQICRSLVTEAIREWRHGKTTIVITHDVSEIKDQDYVYVLEKGKVVQEGYCKQLLEDENGRFISFKYSSHEESKDPFSDNAPTLQLGNTASKPRSERADPHISASSGNESLRMEHPTRSHLSHCFGLNEQLSIREQANNQRASHSMKIGSTFANGLNVTNTWQFGNLPSLSRPFNAKISKSLPRLPAHGHARRSYCSNYTTSDDESFEIELINMRGNSALRNRSQVDHLHRKPQLSYNVGSGARSSASFAGGRRSYWRHEKVQSFANSHQAGTNLSTILGTLWPNLLFRDRIILILGFISAFISASATPAFSYVLARLLGTFSLASGQTEAAETWALAILAIAIADGITSYYMHYLLEHCGQIWINGLRMEALKRIFAQPRAWFDKPKNNPDRLNKCLDRDAEEMRNIVGRFAGYMFLAGSMMSIAIVWAFIVCWKLTLVSLASGPCMYAFTRAFEVVSGRWERKLNEMGDAIGEIFAETFSKIKAVRALSLESYMEEKYTKATAKAYQIGLRRAMYTSFFFGMSDSTNSFVTALILYYGTVIAASGAWSIDSILQVITLLLFSSGNANAAIAFIPQISSSRAAATQLLHLANMPRTASHESQGNTYLPTPLPIHFNSLSFAYPTQPAIKVLHEISLTFPAGSCTAIVGPSGSGKSTIASLLLGLRPPSEALHAPTPSLTFNGVSIFSLDIRALRTQIALVTQSPVLLPATIAENISYGLPAHSPLLATHNIQRAARAAGIHDFIVGLPHGYATLVGDGSGRGLSGGQAQRLCIARALARRPKVLVLDEPTSALDAENARLIRDTIAGLVVARDGDGRREDEEDEEDEEKMAVILITHSRLMMRVADRIVVLEAGRVVQEGTYAELLRRREGAFVSLISGGGGEVVKMRE